MKIFRTVALAGLAMALCTLAVPAVSLAGEPDRHVVGGDEIQARFDQQFNQAAVDRQAIQVLLQRADVRRIASSAGVDIERASSAAAVLSGERLEALAEQARMVEQDLAGGDSTVVISATTVIIVLLIILLLKS